jgi:CDP-paratose 2-epimerase
MSDRILVTGGAGFIGCHVASSYLRDGFDVTIFDALSRRGNQENLAWLRKESKQGQLKLIHGDIRNYDSVRNAADDADVIFHLAAQVAVTSSVVDPRGDFETNALGTLNVLEAARNSGRDPIVVFASTNKVYGALEEVAVAEKNTRYEYRDLIHGIPESQPLDFHSPYGCSKGAGDQYVRDYARIYSLRTVVFRNSCIYGPRQFGTEDQGWLSHLMIAAASGRPLTIYGDGKQVRDILFVEDLIRAFRLSVERISITAGQVYNMGGGTSNTVSVWAEFGQLLAKVGRVEIPVRFDEWRPGDQRCYISDIRKATRDMSWRPQVDKETGIGLLWDWVSSNKGQLRRLFENGVF